MKGSRFVAIVAGAGETIGGGATGVSGCGVIYAPGESRRRVKQRARLRAHAGRRWRLARAQINYLITSSLRRRKWPRVHFIRRWCACASRSDD